MTSLAANIADYVSNSDKEMALLLGLTNAVSYSRVAYQHCDSKSPTNTGRMTSFENLPMARKCVFLM